MHIDFQNEQKTIQDSQVLYLFLNLKPNLFKCTRKCCGVEVLKRANLNYPQVFWVKSFSPNSVDYFDLMPVMCFFKVFKVLKKKSHQALTKNFKNRAADFFDF